MWFEEEKNDQFTCCDCRYGEKEIENPHCGMCLLEQFQTGKKYTQWEEKISKHELLEEFMYRVGIW